MAVEAPGLSPAKSNAIRNGFSRGWPGLMPFSGIRSRHDWNSLLKKSKKQIPSGLKSAQDDKFSGLMTAQLKLRPFKSSYPGLFSAASGSHAPIQIVFPGDELQEVMS